MLVDADPAAAGSLRLSARGQALGTANRWMWPITDGRHWLAVHTPHLGGVLHLYRQDGGQLLARRLQGDLSNHRIGSRLLDMSAWQGQRLLNPDRCGRPLVILDAGSDWRVIGDQVLPAPVTASVSLGRAGWMAVLLEDGTVVAGPVAK